MVNSAEPKSQGLVTGPLVCWDLAPSLSITSLSLWPGTKILLQVTTGWGHPKIRYNNKDMPCTTGAQKDTSPARTSQETFPRVYKVENGIPGKLGAHHIWVMCLRRLGWAECIQQKMGMWTWGQTGANCDCHNHTGKNSYFLSVSQRLQFQMRTRAESITEMNEAAGAEMMGHCRSFRAQMGQQLSTTPSPALPAVIFQKKSDMLMYTSVFLNASMSILTNLRCHRLQGIIILCTSIRNKSNSKSDTPLI